MWILVPEATANQPSVRRKISGYARRALLSVKTKSAPAGKGRGAGKFREWSGSVAGGNRRIDVHATAFTVEAHLAINEGEDRVVPTQTDIFAGQKFRAALADDDIAGDHYLAAEFLNAETLADAVAPILD
jgi:hypothetical protein